MGILQYAEEDDWQRYGDIKRFCYSTAKVAFQNRLSVKHKSSSWKMFIVNFKTELWHWIKLSEQHFTFFTETLYAILVGPYISRSLFLFISKLLTTSLPILISRSEVFTKQLKLSKNVSMKNCTLKLSKLPTEPTCKEQQCQSLITAWFLHTHWNSLNKIIKLLCFLCD